MTLRILSGVAVIAALMGWAAAGGAQELTAEVRTWTGQAWSLAQPSLESYYTIVPREEEGAPGAPYAPGAPGGAPRPGRFSGVQLFGSMQALGQVFSRGPEPLQGHRQAEVLTLYQAGVARQVPLARVVTLVFTRQPVADSSLPPYVSGTHVRYGATAVLTDGTRIDGDYVNLGTAVLRGTTPHGRVDIPWQDIEAIRFGR